MARYVQSVHNFFWYTNEMTINEWLTVPAYIATGLSIFGITPIMIAGLKKSVGPSLCEMAAKVNPSLWYFRAVVWTCGVLFAITMYALVVPGSSLPIIVGIFWTAELIGNMMIAAIPARPATMKLHLVFAQTLGYSMLALAYTFASTLSGWTGHACWAIAIVMTVIGAMTYIDRTRYSFYQAPFIYLSHVTILLAAVSLS